MSLREILRHPLKLVMLGVVFKWLCQVASLKLGILGLGKGPFPMPMLGTIWRIIVAGISNLHRLAVADFQKYGRIHGWAYFHKAQCATICPHHLRRILVTHWKKYDRSDIEQAAFRDLLGRGLILVGNEQWGEVRRVFQSGFSDGNIVAFREVLQVWSADFAQGLLASSTASPVDVQEVAQRLTFRVIGLFTLGVDFEEPQCIARLTDGMAGSAWCCHNYGDLWFQLLSHTQDRVLFGPFQWWRLLKTPHVKAFERGQQLLLAEIDAAFAARMSGSQSVLKSGLASSFKDLASLIVESQKSRNFSQDDLRHQALTFLFAGHDTTTNLIAWCLLLLADHPDVQNRARQEVRNAHECKSVKPFLRCCLLETLRLYPSVPLRSRTLTEQDSFAPVEPMACPALRIHDQVHLQKGMGVAFAINALHRDPGLWCEPDKFQPERFWEHSMATDGTLPCAPRMGDESRPLAYLPFGAGPRRCIGERFALLEAEEVCGAVLGCCRIARPPGPVPVEELRLTMRAKDGIPLVFHPLTGSDD